jgi:ribosomal protein L31
MSESVQVMPKPLVVRPTTVGNTVDTWSAAKRRPFCAVTRNAHPEWTGNGQASAD